MELFIFYFFSTIVVFASLMMITVNNPVKAAFYLVLTFFATAPLWLLLHAEFLAIVLVLVYVGAVMVLFLFVVMMLDINLATIRQGFVKNLPVAILAALALLSTMIMVFNASSFDTHIMTTEPKASNTVLLGTLLFRDYLFQFEVAAVILLVAIIAAISLTLRRRPNTRHQNIDRQVAVKAADRLKVVAVKAQERK